MIRINYQSNLNHQKNIILKYSNNDRIRNFVVESRIKFLIINIRNILLARNFFENFIYFFNKSNAFFYTFDEFDILLEIKFSIIILMKFLLISSTLKSFYLFEIRFEIIFIDHNKSIFFFLLQ